MSMENAIPYEELERRRKKSIAKRKQSMVVQPPHDENESEAMAVINEIFNPSLKIPQTVGHYKVPDEVHMNDLEALKDLDVRKLAELKEVFLLFDTDCDGLLSKDDLRFTFTALGGEYSEELLEEMLKEATEPLDYEAFVDMMSHRTIELDPEDVLLEAWSKWDDYGTGKIDEKRMYTELTNYGDKLSTSEAKEALRYAPLAKPKTLEEPPMIDYPHCADYIEVFPYLREPVIENSTHPEYAICNHTLSPNKTAADEFIYSASKVFGIRVRFRKSSATDDLTLAGIHITVDYRFLRKADFRNEGSRLIAGSYCDYYFFASTDDVAAQLLGPWLHFHSPRFPANYPAHIKCSYKFIGRPDSRVEIIFEELQIPRQPQGCNMDKLTVFDSESANMNAVIDVLCDALPSRRQIIISSGPDLLIEFNASSNLTAKGFRGKFRFPQSGVQRVPVTGKASSRAGVATPANITTTGKAVVTLKKNSGWKSTTEFLKTADGRNAYKANEPCKHIYDSRNKKSGIFDTSSLFAAIIPNVIIPIFTILPGRVQCRYEFHGEPFERVQIKFIDFSIPNEQTNDSNCNPDDSSLQLLVPVHEATFEAAELYCGAFIPKPIMSKNNKLHLQFVGKYPEIGAKTNYYGFKAEYIFRKNFGITTGIQQGTDCVFMYNSTLSKSGWFSSPNFPGLYPQNLICNYYFYGELEELILIRFTYFDVEGIGTCEFSTASDHVEFSNYLSTDRKYAKICGKRDAFEVRSDGRFFRVSFYSNDRFDKTGFRAFYDFESKLTAVDNTSVQSFVGSSAGKIVQQHHWWRSYSICLSLILKFVTNF